MSDKARIIPHALLELPKYDGAAKLIMDGLMQLYMDRVGPKYMKDWEAAAIAAVRLLASLPSIDRDKAEQ